MKKQYAVFGLGKFGSSVAVTLEKLGCEVIAVDIAEEKVQEIADQVSYAMRADLHDTGVIQSLGDFAIWMVQSWRLPITWNLVLWLRFCQKRQGFRMCLQRRRTSFMHPS